MKRVLLLLLISGSTPPVCGQSPDKLAQSLEAATSLIESGRDDLALEILTKTLTGARVVQRNKALIFRLTMLKATVHLRLCDPEETVLGIQTAVQLADGKLEVDAAVLLAEALLVMGDTAAVIKVLGPFKPLLKEYRNGRYLLAEALMQAGKTEEALALLLRLARDEPSAKVQHRLGVLYFEQRKHNEALAAFRRAIEKEPSDYYSRIYAARTYLDLDEPRQAKSAIEDLMGVADTPELHYLAGLIATKKKDPETACQHFRRALKDSPNYTEAVFALAQAQMKLKQKDAAKASLKRFRALHQRDQANLKIASRLEQAWRGRPDDPTRSLELARHYFDTGKLEGAERYAWKSLRCDPKHVDARLLLARALRKQGLYRESAVHYRKLVKANPQSGAARAELEAMIRQHARRRS